MAAVLHDSYKTGFLHPNCDTEKGKWTDLDNSISVFNSLRTLQRNLPIYDAKKKCIELVRENQVLIVTGETGSGKSTQIPQYLYDAGFGVNGRIAITQPRRIAAKALATRVAQEFGCELGDEVGYHIRFDNRTKTNSVICYMTDGILLNEMASDQNIYKYSVIVLDEAHQRHLYTDILFGLLKNTMRHRPDLKVIVTSATLDVHKFSAYFGQAPIFNVTGRTYPVETIYSTFSSVGNYLDACVRTVRQIHREEKPGDILVFLTGKDEIDRCCEALSDNQDFFIIPLYASLPIEQQNAALEPTPQGQRKIVVATNVAETSLTIDGIVYVVDCGKAKVNTFNPQTGLSTLTLLPVSKSEAEQRKGRAGRTRPGKVYRLNTQSYYNQMEKDPIPEIKRRNLEAMILLLAACGIENVSKFDFVDPPNRDMVQAALKNLQNLGALKIFPDRQELTEEGQLMAKFPLDPRLAKILIVSHSLGCTREILIIVSMLSARDTVGDIFRSSRKNKIVEDALKARLFQPGGDQLSFLHVFEVWESKNYSERWCEENCVNFKVLEEAREIQNQLKTLMQLNNIYDDKQDNNTSFRSKAGIVEKISEAMVAGYFNQVAERVSLYGFKGLLHKGGDGQCFIHPSSALFKVNPKPNLIIYEEMMNTGSKTYMRHCLQVSIKHFQKVLEDLKKR